MNLPAPHLTNQAARRSTGFQPVSERVANQTSGEWPHRLHGQDARATGARFVDREKGGDA